MSRLQPGLALGPLRCAWAGQRTFALDGRFVVGWDPRCRGLFWVAALGGHGVTTSPSVGRLAADLLVAGPGTPASPIARALSPARLL
jgi:D-arginine dehydrogenase